MKEQGKEKMKEKVIKIDAVKNVKKMGHGRESEEVEMQHERVGEGKE